MAQQNTESHQQFRSMSVNKLPTFLMGLALGISAAYFLDPNQGRRRRAYLRDQIIGRSNDLRDWRERVSKNFTNRAWGFYRKTVMPPSENVDDQTLIQRVRSEFGREIRHPKAIVTTAADGVVTLSGPVLSHEVRGLIQGVRKVPGVKKVINHLDVRSHSDGISALQGSGPEYLQ